MGETGPSGLNYSRIVTVSADGTEAEAGLRLLQAIESAPVAAPLRPVLIFLEPGAYDIADRRLSLSSSVHLAGAGQDLSIIKFGAGGGISRRWGSLRALSISGSISNGGAGVELLEGGRLDEVAIRIRAEGVGMAVALEAFAQVQLDRVTVSMSGPENAAATSVRGLRCTACFGHIRRSSFEAWGGTWATALDLRGSVSTSDRLSYLELMDVEVASGLASGSANGIEVNSIGTSASVRMRSVRARGTTTALSVSGAGALDIQSSALTAENKALFLNHDRGDVSVGYSRLKAATAIQSSAPPGDVRVAYSQIEGSTTGATCLGVFDGSFAARSCP